MKTKFELACRMTTQPVKFVVELLDSLEFEVQLNFPANDTVADSKAFVAALRAFVDDFGESNPRPGQKGDAARLALIRLAAEFSYFVNIFRQKLPDVPPKELIVVAKEATFDKGASPPRTFLRELSKATPEVRGILSFNFLNLESAWKDFCRTFGPFSTFRLDVPTSDEASFSVSAIASGKWVGWSPSVVRRYHFTHLMASVKSDLYFHTEKPPRPPKKEGRPPSPPVEVEILWILAGGPVKLSEVARMVGESETSVFSRLASKKLSAVVIEDGMLRLKK